MISLKRQEIIDKSWKRLEDTVRGRGVILSDKSSYINSHSRVVIKCNCGCEWNPTHNKVVSGKWCPECARKLSPEVRWNNILKAIDGKGEIVSKFSDYKNTKEDLEFKCNCGYQWYKNYHEIVNVGRWCPFCSKSSSNPDRLWRNLLDKIEGKGKVLSDISEYRNDRTELTFECSFGHRFTKEYRNVVQSNGWCPHCVEDIRKNNWEEVNRKVVGKGKVLSEYSDYKNLRTRINLECNCGHQWDSIAANVKYGYWCPKCVGHKTPSEKWKLIKETIKGKGKPITKFNDFVKIHTKINDSHLEIECNCGHQWKITYSNLVLHKRWCPKCCQSVGERYVRVIFETYFGLPFPSKRPSWNKHYNQRHPHILDSEYNLLKTEKREMPKQQQAMELDGYNETKSIAFEYQGHHHHELIRYNKIDFIRRLKAYATTNFHDIVKKKNCEERGIKLYIIDQIRGDSKKCIRKFIEKIKPQLANQGLIIDFTEEQLVKMEKIVSKVDKSIYGRKVKK